MGGVVFEVIVFDQLVHHLLRRGVLRQLLAVEQALQTVVLGGGVLRVLEKGDGDVGERQRVDKGKLLVLQRLQQRKQNFVGAIGRQQIPVELDGKGHAVDHQRPAVAVVDAAARGRHRDGAVDAALALLAVALAVDNLQIGQPPRKEQGEKNRERPEQGVSAFVTFVEFGVATLHEAVTP